MWPSPHTQEVLQKLEAIPSAALRWAPSPPTPTAEGTGPWVAEEAGTDWAGFPSEAGGHHRGRCQQDKAFS